MAGDNDGRKQAPWYGEGLCFSCTRCGSCCRGEGYVWVDSERIRIVSRYLGISADAFMRRYVRQVDSGLSLTEKANRDCVFWEPESGCRIYRVRPDQCRTFPFWSANLETPEDWEGVAAECPGMNRGRLHGADEIGALARRG